MPASDNEASDNIWSVMPWLVPEAGSTEPDGEGGGSGSIEWQPALRCAVPEAILDYLQACSPAEGCQLLAAWTVEGLPNLLALGDGAGPAAVGNTGGLSGRHEALRQLCETWAGSFVETGLEKVQAAIRGIAALGRQHPQVASPAIASVANLQRAVTQAYGAPVMIRMRL